MASINRNGLRFIHKRNTPSAGQAGQRMTTLRRGVTPLLRGVDHLLPINQRVSTTPRFAGSSLPGFSGAADNGHGLSG
jgi:hypothetical protein